MTQTFGVLRILEVITTHLLYSQQHTVAHFIRRSRRMHMVPKGASTRAKVDWERVLFPGDPRLCLSKEGITFKRRGGTAARPFGSYTEQLGWQGSTPETARGGVTYKI